MSASVLSPRLSQLFSEMEQSQAQHVCYLNFSSIESCWFIAVYSNTDQVGMIGNLCVLGYLISFLNAACLVESVAVILDRQLRTGLE